MKNRGVMWTLLVVVLIVVAGVLYTGFWHYHAAQTEIKSKTDLTQLLGCDFSKLHIQELQVWPIMPSSLDATGRSSYSSICVVLEGDVPQFYSDPFVCNDGGVHYKNEEIEKRFALDKASGDYPLLAAVDFQQTANHGCNWKDFETREFFFTIVQQPYEIHWFTYNVNGKQKVYIYADIPQQISVDIKK